MKMVFTLILLILVFIAGCTRGPETEQNQQKAISACINECRTAVERGRDLSNGPCLSDSVYPSYVCDVAHDPREDVDNLPENQCEAYRSGDVSRFVEVDENCNLIRAT